MNELANRIQVAINTLQTLEIKATFDNMNHMMGAIQTLAMVRDELEKMDKAEVVELFSDGEKIVEETIKEGDGVHE